MNEVYQVQYPTCYVMSFIKLQLTEREKIF